MGLKSVKSIKNVNELKKDKKNSTLNTIEDKKNQVVAELKAIITPNVGFIGNAGSVGFGVGIAPDVLASMYGLIGLEGFQNPISPNYGNYLHVMSGSVLVFIPKHYVKYSVDINALSCGDKTLSSIFSVCVELERIVRVCSRLRSCDLMSAIRYCGSKGLVT